MLTTDLFVLPALVAALPWWLAPAIVYFRFRSTPSLDDFPPIKSSTGTARVSVILPARDEAAHIAECVRAILRSTWPDLELIVVDDHSADGTAALARGAADGDMRLTLVSAPDLPPGWFGKQWACETGAMHATGSLLLFTDADTRHSPDLVARMLHARERRGAELMSVAGRQEMATIWERAVQPCVFALILLRYGGTTAVERARSASDVLANGQCFMLSREGYDKVGRHQAVRDYVAEDLMMAQAVWSSGGRVSFVLGVRQLSTRMYDGLGSLIKGWGKNVYAGGRFAMRGGTVGRALYPLILLSFPSGILLPFMVLPWALLHHSASWVIWSTLACVGTLLTFSLANRINRDSAWRALYAPIGGAVLLVICIFAIIRGRSVSWKGRGYQSR